MAFSDPRRLIVKTVRSLWFTPAIYALIAIAVLGLAPMISPVLPDGMMKRIGLQSVYDLLTVLANSLLAVSIFSLGILASSRLCCANAAKDSACESSLLDRLYEQTEAPHLPHLELA
jgi:uncharacterized membrane protein